MKYFLSSVLDEFLSMKDIVFVSVGLWFKSILIPLLPRFIKLSRKGISLSLNSMENWIALLTEFKVSNSFSGSLFLSNGVLQSSKKRFQFSKINSWNSFLHLRSQILWKWTSKYHIVIVAYVGEKMVPLICL